MGKVAGHYCVVFLNFETAGCEMDSLIHVVLILGDNLNSFPKDYINIYKWLNL